MKDRQMAKSVFVGCKIPTGLLLQLRNADNVVIASAQLDGAAQKGTLVTPAPNALKDDGASVTVVDGEFWEAWEKWAKENKYPPYMNGFVFAADRQQDVKATARERQSDLTRLEGLDMDGNDPRALEFKRGGLTKVTE